MAGASVRPATDVICQLELEDIKPALGDDLAIQLFRIVQDALSNIDRHARATQFTIKLAAEAETIFLCIADNGRGVQQQELVNPKSFGLHRMRERALAYGGRLVISSRPGLGTRVEIRIPRPDQHAANSVLGKED